MGIMGITGITGIISNKLTNMRVSIIGGLFYKIEKHPPPFGPPASPPFYPKWKRRCFPCWRQINPIEKSK